ncbi:MAG: VOC family protein [Candidatus Rokubacteria bacterium]|nr:VOC family protein [Candidatus Rokubacteria bacterium]
MRIRTESIHHVSLRVNDLKRACDFYGDVLGFDIQDLGKLLYFTVGSTFVVLWPPNPGTPPNDRVIDTRVGFDHVAFHVGDRGELDKAVEMLRSARVPTAGIERDPTLDKDYVCFRDPDNVQWEFYHVPAEASSAQRRAQLRAVADQYFEALSRKDFALIPYDEKVTLRAPLAPGGVNRPLVGREALQTVWWPPLVPAVGKVTVLDHYINDSLTAICSEALVEVVAVKPPATLRVADRFTVNREGKIIEQENHFDPRDVTNPGWQTA